MPTGPVRPLPFHLARASWVAPLLVLGMVAVLRNAGTSSGNARSVVITVVGTVLYLTGIVCGVIALFGIGRHGRKGILIPALVGIGICGALLAGVAVSFWSAFRHASDPQARLESAVAAFRADLPQPVDDDTTLVDVIAEPGRLVYEYSFNEITSEAIDLERFEEEAAPVVRDRICGPMRPFFEADFSVVVRYTAADDVVLGEILLTPTDCGVP